MVAQAAALPSILEVLGSTLVRYDCPGWDFCDVILRSEMLEWDLMLGHHRLHCIIH